MARSRLRTRRGATLVVTVTITAVLTVIAAGMIRRGQLEMESAAARRSYDQAVTCAEGAREMLLSNFRMYGVDVSALTLDATTGGRRLASGHYDSFGVRSIQPADRAGVNAHGEGVMDLSNRSVRVALGGAYWRITVVCSDSQSTARQSEVEFLVRFGL